MKEFKATIRCIPLVDDTTDRASALSPASRWTGAW